MQAAAANALTVVGCEIKTNEPNRLEGVRSRKVGAVVGSGGEKLSVDLTAVEGGKTEIKVRITKTFVGRAGQEVWDEQILEEINKALAARDS